MFGCFGVCTCIYKITHIWLFDHTLGAYVFYIYVHIWLFDHTLGAYVYTQNVRVYITCIYIQTEFRCLFLGLLAPTTCTGLSMFYIFERPLWGRTGQMCMYIQCMCICIYIYILVCVCIELSNCDLFDFCRIFKLDRFFSIACLTNLSAM